jgi:O-acetyl-ADP-ribose deacetylase
MNRVRKLELKAVLGDITKVKGDAIVNAAQESLIRGGGVDGTIHAVAGAQLQEECLVGGVQDWRREGDEGLRLACKMCHLHCRPVFLPRHLDGTKDGLLACCYRRSLELAEQLGCQSIAFPAISTGVYGFPKETCRQDRCLRSKALLRQHPVGTLCVLQLRKLFHLHKPPECEQ